MPERQDDVSEAGAPAVCALPARLRLESAARVLVFAPHPDDECIGCGGALALLARTGVPLRVVLVSDGSGAGGLPDGAAVTRQREFQAAIRHLGVTDCVMLGLPDGALTGHPELQRCVRQQIDAFSPDWIFGPSITDLHGDHRAVAQAVRLAARSSPAVERLCEYETWSALPVTHVLDISAVLDTKLDALAEHRTALVHGNYLEATKGLARYRGLLLGRPGSSAAEGFVCLSPESGFGFDGEQDRRVLLPVAHDGAPDQRLVDAQARCDQLLAQLQATTADYAALELGYRRVTTSLSWRITAPLRAVRAGWSRTAIRALARRVPMSPAMRQRLKAWLASSRWGARMLGWLIEPPRDLSTDRTGTSPVAPLDKEAVRAEAEQVLTEFLAAGSRLVLPQAGGTPKVSVVVVLFNQAGLSLLCLQALARSRAPSFELIIVDNASTDRVPQLLERIDGAVVLRQSENLGFLRAVNLAANHARGEQVLLLNNDAVVSEDALACATRRLDTEPDAGAVGGPILLWDGRLQEAGSIIWRDGSCVGYGRGDAPDAGPYRFVRDVDYCSGAFLMARRKLFESMARFDEQFAPAYYEESDFCVRLLEAGHRVVYDPAVRVKHFEFASDTGSGSALALQARNREYFARKHADFLAHQCMPSPLALLQARMRLPAGTQRLLVIDDRVPVPSLGRGYPRAAHLAHALVRAGAFLTHYPLLSPQESWETVYRTLPERAEVMLGLGLAGLAGFLKERTGYYDIVLVSRPHNMEVVQAIRAREPQLFEGTRLIYDAEALFSQRDIVRAAVLGSPMSPSEQQRIVAGEMRLAEGAHAIVTVSECEARHFREAGHRHVHVLGHGLTVRPGTAGFDARHGFLFVGALEEGEQSPNTDSLNWFVRQVWPGVVAALGERATLEVVGPCESPRIRALAGNQIRVRGRVEDVTPFYDAARVFIVPTRFAAGIPHKAHEAAANGLPMVVSALIGEQLGWDSATVARAGDAAAFVDACLALHEDRQQWELARQRAMEAVSHDCAPNAFERTVRQLLLGTARD